MDNKNFLDTAELSTKKGKPALHPAQNGDCDPEAVFEEQSRKNVTHINKPQLESQEAEVYRSSLRILNQTQIPYAVGAALARNAYTSIWRTTKDLDIFLMPENLESALEALSAAGFETRIEEEHWLAKATQGKQVVDLIFGTGHGQLVIDESWFERSRPVEILGVGSRLLPIEEMIALAAFVAERNRFDGSEVMHLILSAKGELDWQRVLDLLGENWQLLLWHLILFDYIYPGHPEYLPQELMADLFRKMQQHWSRPAPVNTFRGAILDPFSYTVDIEDLGFQDRRDQDTLLNQGGKPV